MDDVDIIISIDHDDVLPGSNLIEVINQWIEDFYAEEYNSLHTVRDTKSGYSLGNPTNAVNRLNSFPHYSEIPVNPNQLQSQPPAVESETEEPKKGPFSIGFEGSERILFCGLYRFFSSFSNQGVPFLYPNTELVRSGWRANILFNSRRFNIPNSDSQPRRYFERHREPDKRVCIPPRTFIDNTF